MSETWDWDRVVVEDNQSWSTSVSNWNALANLASGSLLFAIADDLVPAENHWDLAIWNLLSGWEPQNSAFVVKFTDSANSRDTLIRHPLVSRRHFQRHGFWNPQYRGMWVDRDFTLNAFWKSLIIDGRMIRFSHLNPIADHSIGASKSFLKANRAEEYEFGERQFRKRWPSYLIGTRIKFIQAHRASHHRLRSLLLRLREVIGIVFRSRFLRPIRVLWLNSKHTS